MLFSTVASLPSLINHSVHMVVARHGTLKKSLFQIDYFRGKGMN